MPAGASFDNYRLQPVQPTNKQAACHTPICFGVRFVLIAQPVDDVHSDLTPRTQTTAGDGRWQRASGGSGGKHLSDGRPGRLMPLFFVPVAGRKNCYYVSGHLPIGEESEYFKFSDKSGAKVLRTVNTRKHVRKAMSSDCVVIVHAGVGRRSARSSSLVANLCELAARKGRQLGRSSGDPTAAVVEAIRILENSPLTNAGIGSNVNRDGVVECDASLIEGWSQNGGAVAAVPSAANAILIAQMLAQKNGPACLAGPGALRWFRENGGEMPDRSKDLVTSYQRKMFRQYSTAGSSAASRRVDTGGGGFGGHHSGCRSAAAAVVSGATPSAAAGCCGVRGGGAASAAAKGDDALMLSEGETRCVVAAAAALAEAAGDFAGPVDTDFATTTTTTTIVDDDGGGGGNGGDDAAVPGARNKDDDGGDDCVDDGEDERGGREDEEHNRVDDDNDDDDDDDDGDDDDDLRRRLDTVGAVALVGGRIAAGVSSGGIFLKPPGRVGQAGVYGAGCYADRSAGVSTSGTGDHLIRTLLATKCVNALTNAIQPDPPSMGDDDDEPDGMKPPAMILKTVLEEKFVNAPVVRNSQGPQIAAGVVGVVYDDKSGLCDLVWGHTSGNFIVAYAAPGTAKRNEVRSEICSQRDIDDIEEMKVYASGTVIRLR